MANETTSTTLDDLLAPMVAEALFVASEKSILRGLVRNYKMPKRTGKTVQVPIYGNVTAAAVAEATDLTNTAVSTSKVDLTVSEVGLMTTVTDFARNTSASDVISDVGRLFGEAIARKIDLDISALFDTFSTEVGDGTAVTNAASVFEAIANLKANSVPSGDLACVVHPMIAYDLKSSLTSTFGAPASQLGNQAMRDGYIGSLGGCNVYEHNMANTGNVGDFKGAVFHRDALGLAVLEDIKIESQRDASMRATELVGSATYAVGKLHDSYGVELHGDSTIL